MTCTAPGPSFLLLAVVVLGACGGAPPDADAHPPPGGSATPTADSAPATVVDSVLPMDVALGRFRADLDEATRLTSGAASRDELVRRIVDALAAADTAAFEALAVNRSEWAWLYFPTSPVALPPYELPPGLAWFQLQEGNRKGVLRALRELGGRRIDYRGYRCPDEPTIQGNNQVWSDCRVTLSRDGADPVTIALFGAILDRDDRFAILSYANDF